MNNTNLTIFGVPIHDFGLEGVLAKIKDIVLSNSSGKLIITANPEILLEARKNKDYKNILQSAELVLPDGVGVTLASLFYSRPILNGRVIGRILAEELIKISKDNNYTIFLTGTQNNDILSKAIENLKNKSVHYCRSLIVGSHAGPQFSKDDKYPLNDLENEKLLDLIKQTKPDILLVAFGHPKQEMWLKHYLPQLPVKVGIGIGGTLDYWAGLVDKPPILFSKFGLEWLWRLIKQPKIRFKRVFRAVVLFPSMMWIELLKKLFIKNKLD